VLSGNVSKFFIPFILCMLPDSTPFLVRRVLQDRRQSESEYVFKVLPFVHCVPTIITYSLFIGFERTSNEWKVEKVNYDIVWQVF
jgi:hypothetical protein